MVALSLLLNFDHKRTFTETTITAVNFETQTVELVGSPDSFCVLGELGNKAIKFLLDTGAAISAVNEQYLENFISDRFSVSEVDQLRINSVDGHQLQVKGKIELPVRIGNQTFLFDFYVIKDLSYEAILGFLTKFRCNIDMGNGVLHIETQNVFFSFC